MTTLTDLKLAHRATWASGDYPAVAERIDAVPPLDLLDRLTITPGQDVLDVATGTGNVRCAPPRRARASSGSTSPPSSSSPPAARPSTAPPSSGSPATRRSCPSTTAASITFSPCSASSSARSGTSPATGARRASSLALISGLADVRLVSKLVVPLPTTTPHSLRRTYMSVALLATGFDVLFVMSQVGHADSKMTTDVYAQLQQRVKRDHGSAFDGLVARAREELRGASRGAGRASIGTTIGTTGAQRS